MLCGDGFTADGEICMVRAHISRETSMEGATLSNRGATALCAEGLEVDGNMLCRGKFKATGQITLTGAHISGELDIRVADVDKSWRHGTGRHPDQRHQ